MSEKIELTLQVADQVQGRRQAWHEIVAGKLERLEAIDYGTEAISDPDGTARVFNTMRQTLRSLRIQISDIRTVARVVARV